MHTDPLSVRSLLRSEITLCRRLCQFLSRRILNFTELCCWSQGNQNWFWRASHTLSRRNRCETKKKLEKCLDTLLLFRRSGAMSLYSIVLSISKVLVTLKSLFTLKHYIVKESLPCFCLHGDLQYFNDVCVSLCRWLLCCSTPHCYSLLPFIPLFFL